MNTNPVNWKSVGVEAETRWLIIQVVLSRVRDLWAVDLKQLSDAASFTTEPRSEG